MLKSNEWVTIETIKQILISQGSQEMKTSESYNQILEEARRIMDKANH